MDSVECNCGARTAVGYLDDKGEVLFVGGSYKNGIVKSSNEPGNEAAKRCLWCGTEWPENLKAALKNTIKGLRPE